MRQLISKIKPTYYLEIEDAEDIDYIDDDNVRTVTQAIEMARKLANITGKRVKLRSMVSLGVVEPNLVTIDPATGAVT